MPSSKKEADNHQTKTIYVLADSVKSEYVIIPALESQRKWKNRKQEKFDML